MNADTKMILEEMNKRFDCVDARFDGVDARFDGVDARLDGMDARLDNVELDIRGIKVVIENEIKRDIKLVAEGHGYLVRNINELRERESRNDKLELDVLWLKGQMEKVNKRIDSIA